jgi:hypothetical protein
MARQPFCVPANPVRLQSLHHPEIRQSFPELPEGMGSLTLWVLMAEIALTQPFALLSAAPGM